MERFHFASLVTRCEAPSEKSQEKFAGAFNSDRPLSYSRFQSWTGRRSEIRAAGAGFPEDQLRRYLKALVFRKFLVARRPVLHNLSLLFMVPSMFRFWCGLSRLSRGSPQVDWVDVQRALDECECRILTHARNIEEGLDLMANDFLEQIDL